MGCSPCGSKRAGCLGGSRRSRVSVWVQRTGLAGRAHPLYHSAMRRVEHTLDVPETPGEGEGQDVSTYVEKWVEVRGTFTGTVTVQGQLTAEGGWYDVEATDPGTPALIQVLPLFRAIRLDTSDASGTVFGELVALDRRTT